MFKMGSHHPFGHLKHKLWLKERLGVKLALRVGNQPDFLTCRQRAIYRWKVCNKGYNVASDFIVIRGLHTKLCTPKVARILVVGIVRLPFGSLGTKCHLDVAPMERRKEYYKGEGGGFPQVWAVVSLVSPRLLMAHPSTQKCWNYALTNVLFGLCRFEWVNKLFVILLSPILELQHTFLPPKCCEPTSACLGFACLGFNIESWVHKNKKRHASPRQH
jgi:hypothetical protein